MRNSESVRHAPPVRATGFVRVFLAAVFALVPLNQVIALHKTDHRFTVEGRVCGTEGQGLEGVKVTVKDTRNSVATSSKTNGEGYYKAVLHLHNENEGDTLEIKALSHQEAAKVAFDPHDIKTERIITIDLGSPCAEPSNWGGQWVYYVIGASLVGAAGILGAKAIRRKVHRSSPKGKRSKKGQRKD